MNGFRHHEVATDRKWSNFGRSDYTKPDGDGRNRRVTTFSRVRHTVSYERVCSKADLMTESLNDHTE